MTRTHGTSRPWRAAIVVFAVLACSAAPPGGDNSNDVGVAFDASLVDPDTGSVPTFDALQIDSPRAVDDVERTPQGEVCFNGLDDNQNNRVDEGCPCVPGTTQRCYAGPPQLAGIGACVLGSMRCLGVGEYGTWSPCSGSGTPVGDACDGIDNNCNGRVDENCACRIGERRSCYTARVGTRGLGTCRDGMQMCQPFAAGFGSVWSVCAGEVGPAPDVCDGFDNDCDGTVDNGCVCVPGAARDCYGGPSGTMNVGACRGGRQTCVMTAATPAWGNCTGQVLPGAEVCGDGIDNNCNGRVDDGCECRLNESRPCYTGPMGTGGMGVCRNGAQRCVAGTGGSGTTWGSCEGSVLPGVEVCDGLDNDCNGTVDDGCACRPGTTESCYSGPAGTAGRGICLAGSRTCVAGPRGVGASWTACVGQVLPMTEVCNRADDDCDGAADEGLSCTGPTVMCPASITASAGSVVTLAATPSTPGTYLWEVISAPMGAAYTLGSPNAATTTFTSVIVGTFTLRFTVTDAMGRSASCTTTVTMQGHGLRVEMVWDTDGTDMDLHVHNALATRWFEVPNDAYFANRRPEWDAPGAMDNPVLDTDDTDGRGPENIRVDAPPTTQIYTVGVHYYAGMPPTNVTVRIYCGDRLAAPAFVRSLLAAGGVANDFWRLARVQFTSLSTCTVTPINDVITANAARMGSP